MRSPLTQGEIESMILDLSDELEAETERYSDVSDLVAEAEVEYKLRRSRAWVALANSGTKMSAAERDHRTDVSLGDELRAYKLTEARRAASREALLSLRTRMDALRTLSANVRAQT